MIISYCCGTFPCLGGVARYDTQLHLVFPNRVFFKGPEEKDKMLDFLIKCDNPIIITDNHLACDIPNNYKCILVHHVVAKTHAIRDPSWNKYWRDLCCKGQEKMLNYRSPDNTIIISISQFCTDEFLKYFPEVYPKFKNIKLLHSSEMDDNIFKTKFNTKPVVLGNWKSVNKGSNIVNKLQSKTDKFIFKKLDISKNKDENLINFNKKKQNIYLQSDIYLQISLSEGNSYATLDALLNGLVVVSTNVGLFYKDLPKDCFVELDWQNTDVNYINKKLEYAWENRHKLSKKAREWYIKNCKFVDWKNKMIQIVDNFKNDSNLLNNTHYNKKYFKWQNEIGKIGGKLNKFKFEKEINNDDILLDFGCGGGYLLENFNNENKYGFEINPEAILKCKEKKITVFNSWFDINDNYFDKIISNHALEHVPNPLEVLKNLYRIIKKNGKIIIIVPCEQPSENSWKYKENDINQHLYTWCPQSLGNLVKLAGFKILSCVGFQHQWCSDYKKKWNQSNFHNRCIEYAKKNNNYQIKLVAIK